MSGWLTRKLGQIRVNILCCDRYDGYRADLQPIYVVMANSGMTKMSFETLLPLLGELKFDSCNPTKFVFAFKQEKK